MKPWIRTLVIVLVIFAVSVAAAVILDPFSVSEYADDKARLTGAGALCLVFCTTLIGFAKFFGAFPNRSTGEPSPHRSDSRKPLLTGQQTVNLLRLFQHSIILKMLEQLVYVCDAVNNGRDIPSQESLQDQLETARHEARGALLGLPIPFGEDDLERMYGSADVKKDIADAYEIACDTSKSLEARVRGFLEIARGRSQKTLHDYRRRFENLDIPL